MGFEVDYLKGTGKRMEIASMFLGDELIYEFVCNARLHILRAA